MTDNLEYIDNYFKKELTPEESGQFEQRITDDPVFAEEVAFYLGTRETLEAQLAADKKERFRAIYNDREAEAPVVRMNPIRKLWPYISAAAVMIVLVARFVFFNMAVSPIKLADEYMRDNFQNLGVPMGSDNNLLSKSKNLFNEGKLEEALITLEPLVQTESSNYEALEIAGIAALRLEEYDKAISYFQRLENYPKKLISNPGKFYHALALLKRNQPGDQAAARPLLQQVMDEDLEGKKTARKWLGKKWE